MKYEFVQARNYKKVDQRYIDLAVLHTMESPEKPDTAEAVAAWFAGSNAPIASAHYCIDNNSIVQCVRDHDVAYAAPGANHNGLHFELAGRAAQTVADWHDAYSEALLKRAASLVALKCKAYGIPIRWLTAADVKAGKHGITTHANVSTAFRLSDHHDPGPHFPAQKFIRLVKAAAL